MQPFKITCVTCQARLTVRNESAIGQILACPRCGSMVQVAVPAAATGGPRAAAVVPVVASVTMDAPAPPGEFERVADIGAELESLDASSHAGGAPPPAPPVGSPSKAASAVASTRIGAAKLVAFSAVAAAAGSAIVAAIMLLRGPSSSAGPDGAAPGQSSPTALEEQRVAVDAAHEFSDEGSAAAANLDEPDSLTPPGVIAPDASLERDATPPLDVALDPTPTEGEAGEASTDVASTPPRRPTPPGVPAERGGATPEVAERDAPAEAAATPRIVLDPLEFDPEGLDLSSLLRGAEEDPLAASNLGDDPPAVDSVAGPAADADAQGAAAPDVDHKQPPQGGPPVNPGRLLARHIPAVRVDGVPLCRFLDFAVQISGLPVSVAPDELQLAAVSAATPMSVDIEDATIEQLLAEAFKPLRLQPEVTGGQIVLRRAAADVRRELEFPIDDLVRNEAEAKRLAGWVQNLVAPDSWQVHGGQGILTVDARALRVNQAARLGYETILFLERYRTARGLPPRSEYLRELLLSLGSRAALGERLTAPATFTFVPATPLREIFRWWQEELETAVLVDWPALERQRMWPETRVTASSIDRPWNQALTESLKPLGLGWRAIDGRTLQITTVDEINESPRLEFYELAEGGAADGSDLLASLAKLAGNPAAATATTALDAAHGVLMVRHPSATQRRIAAWLADQGLLSSGSTR